MIYKQGKITKHFDTAKSLILLVGLFVIGFTVWYVDSTYTKVSKLYAVPGGNSNLTRVSLLSDLATSKTFGSSKDITTFTYPADWLIKALPNNTIWYAQLSPVEIAGTLGQTGFLRISPLLTALSTPAESITNANFYNLKAQTPDTTMTIHGYNVHFATYLDPSNNWTYNNYYFFYKSDMIEFSFVNSAQITRNKITTTMNFSKYINEENSILSTVQINV